MTFGVSHCGGRSSLDRASPGLVVSLVVATALVLVRFAMAALPGGAGGALAPGELMAALVASAALCGAALTIRAVPAVAWLSTATAAGIAAEEIVRAARVAQPAASADAWAALVVISVIALAGGAGVAASYAVRRREPTVRTLDHLVGLLVGGGVVAGAAAGIVAMLVALDEVSSAVASPDLVPIRLAARLSLGVVGIGLLIGLLRDVAGPVARTRERRRAAAAAGAARSTTWSSDLADELLPMRPRERRRAAEQERARLAADIHAFVLPELRQAAAGTSSADVPDHVAASLRRSLESVEQLMHDRQSIVLEQYGLVAALEWLAERTEERSGLQINLDIDGNRAEDGPPLPSDVARLAFRVALLAVDNVVRHANAGVVDIALRLDRGVVVLSVVDDGRAVPASRPGGAGRGLADMRSEAAALGAALSVAGSEAGTRVDLRWHAPSIQGSSAIDGAILAARPDPPAG